MSKKFKQHQAILPGATTGVKVVDGDIAFALRTFKKQVKESGKLLELNSRKHYVKPSVARRFTKQQAIYRRQKDEQSAE